MHTFLETRIQRLLDCLIFVEKGLGVHVQLMLKMRRVYTLAEILSKIFEKKGNWEPYLRSWFDNLTIWCQLFLYKYIMRSVFPRLTPLHSENNI